MVAKKLSKGEAYGHTVHGERRGLEIEDRTSEGQDSELGSRGLGSGLR